MTAASQDAFDCRFEYYAEWHERAYVTFEDLYFNHVDYRGSTTCSGGPTVGSTTSADSS